MIDYDKEPIVIKNNFTVIMYGFTFLLLIDLFLVYALFFANIINWNVDLHWYEILKNEMQKSVRFASIVVPFFIANIGALINLIKRLKKPYKIYLYNNKIYSYMPDITIELDNVKHIYKSPYPIWGKKIKNEIMFYLTLLIMICFLLITNLLIFLARLCCKIVYRDCKLSLFYNIAILDNKNQIINIQILSHRNYKLIKQYFQSRKYIDIENCELMFKFYTTKAKNNGKN